MSKNNTPTSLSTTISTRLSRMYTEFHNEAVNTPTEFDPLKSDTVGEATNDLLAAFEKHLPEKKRIDIEIPDTLHRNIGYNQAITDITQLIKENREGL